MSEAVIGHGHHDPHHDHAHEPHLAGPSIWPFILAIGLGLAAWGFAVSMSSPRLGSILLGVGGAVAGLGQVLWWKHMIAETAQTPIALADSADDQVIKDWKMGFLLFIASEIMFFGAFFAYYFYSRTVAPVWPPEGSGHIGLLLPTVNTLLLITSGFTFNYAHHALRHGKRRSFHAGLILTLILGTIFMGGQFFEYAHLDMTVSSGSLGTAFYMLTGFHGAHVVIGLIMIATMLGRSYAGNYLTKGRHFGVEATGWYWHFVDVVWIFLYLVLYLF